MQSVSILDDALTFQQSRAKCTRAIHAQIMIDQSETIATLLQRIAALRGINFIGKVEASGLTLELTKPLIYVLKDARKQAVSLLFEERYTLEEIGIMDR